MPLSDRIHDLEQTISDAVGDAVDGLRRSLARQLSDRQRSLAEGARRRAFEELHAAVARLDEARDQVAVLGALLEEGGRFASRTAFFVTTDEGVRGWGSFGFGEDAPSVDGFAAELGDEPWRGLGEQAGYRETEDGPLPGWPIGGETPRAALLVPLVLRDRLAGAFYADTTEDGAALAPAALRLLVHSAAQALETLTVREVFPTATLHPAAGGTSLALWEAEAAPAPPAPATPAPEPREGGESEGVDLAEGEAEAGAADAISPAELAEIAPPMEAWEGEVEDELPAAAPEEAEAEPEDAAGEEDRFDEDQLDEDQLEEDQLEEDQVGEDQIGEVDFEEAEPVPDEEEETTEVDAEELPYEVEEPEETEPWQADEEEEMEVVAASEVTVVEDEEDAELATEEGGPEEIAEVSAAETAVEDAPVTTEDVEEREDEEDELSEDRTVLLDRSQLEAPPPESTTPIPTPPRPSLSGSPEVAPPPDLEGPGLAFRSEAEAAPPAAQPRDAESAGLHEEARRLARLLVSEIKLYNEEQVEEGRRRRDIYRRLREDIDRSRQMYEERVDPRVRGETDYFQQEMVNILAGGDAGALGT